MRPTGQPTFFLHGSNKKKSWQISLVGGLEHYIFYHILGIIIPIDQYFFRGGVKPPTRSFSMDYLEVPTIHFQSPARRSQQEDRDRRRSRASRAVGRRTFGRPLRRPTGTSDCTKSASLCMKGESTPMGLSMSQLSTTRRGKRC